MLHETNNMRPRTTYHGINKNATASSMTNFNNYNDCKVSSSSNCEEDEDDFTETYEGDESGRAAVTKADNKYA